MSIQHANLVSEGGDLHVFPGAQAWHVNDLGIMNAHTINNHNSYVCNGTTLATELVKRLKLNPLHDASHKRNRKIAPPDSQCLPGTRQGLLEELSSWVKNGTMDCGRSQPGESVDNAVKPVCWMYGSFGCGKSAVAQTVAEEYGRKGRLAAAFFFFRNSGERSSIARFPDTLAHQISMNVPGAKEFIDRAVMKDPGLTQSTCSLDSQLQHLVFEPILKCLAERNVPHDVPYLIVADGLDECADKEAISHFIDLVIAFFSRNPNIPLRLLITSRVEEHIRTHVEDGGEIIHLVNLSGYSSRSDIKHCMEVFVTEARKRDRALQALPDIWPSEQDVDKLVDYCDGSFIFGSTLARFVIGGLDDRDSRTPMERLPLALQINPGIDGVYKEVLSRAQHLPHFQIIILTIACVEKPLSISALSVLLNISTYGVLRVLVLLQGILQVPGRDDIPVTVFHSSLRDFLLDEERSGNLHSPLSHHGFLFNRCLELLLGSEPTTNVDCNKYAFIYWPVHLKKATAMAHTTGDGSSRISNEHRPSVLRVWASYDSGSYGGRESIPVRFTQSFDEVLSTEANQRALLSSLPFPNLDGRVPLFGDEIQLDPKRWSDQPHIEGRIESLCTCSLKDIIQGFCVFESRLWCTILSIKVGSGVSIVLKTTRSRTYGQGMDISIERVFDRN